MPIPNFQIDPSPEETSSRSPDLRMVEDWRKSAAAASSATSLLYPRIIAHYVDLLVVTGLSVYCAKLCSVVLLSLHSQAITASGKQAAPMLREAFAYSSGWMLTGSFVTFSMLYFVALPFLSSGRTLGLGLLGMQIRCDDGQPLKMGTLFARLAGCALNYATMGALCLIGMRKHNETYLQDVMSHSHITRG